MSDPRRPRFRTLDLADLPEGEELVGRGELARKAGLSESTIERLTRGIGIAPGHVLPYVNVSGVRAYPLGLCLGILELRYRHGVRRGPRGPRRKRG